MKRFKYPRTLHHPRSLSISSDDKVISKDDLSNLLGEEVVVTEKMDGENSTIYPDGYTHARSIDSKYHSSRTILKSLAATVGYLIPEDLRICAENLYARHSIAYDNLQSFVMAFSVWRGDTCLSWDEAEELLNDIGIPTVNVVYRGVLTESIIESLWESVDTSVSEGLVFRYSGEIALKDFSKKVFKMVRSNHVTTDSHWMSQEVIPNVIS